MTRSTWRHFICLLVLQTIARASRERMPMAHELIDSNHDFTVNEEIAIDPDVIQYAATPDEMRDRWRQRIKYVSCRLKQIRRQIKRFARNYIVAIAV